MTYIILKNTTVSVRVSTHKDQEDEVGVSRSVTWCRLRGCFVEAILVRGHMMLGKSIRRAQQTVTKCLHSWGAMLLWSQVFSDLYCIERHSRELLAFQLVLVPPNLAEVWLFLLDLATAAYLCLVTLFELDCWYPDNEDWNHPKKLLLNRFISFCPIYHPVFSTFGWWTRSRIEAFENPY